MGKIDRQEAIDLLTELNVGSATDAELGAMLCLNSDVSVTTIVIYVDAMLAYMEAMENIQQHGTITAHPRTGSPMENPYLKVQKMFGDMLSKSNLKTGDLWTR